MISTMFAAVIIGFSLGVYVAYMVKVVYRFKGTPKVDLVRLAGGVSVSLLGPGSLYLLKLLDGKGRDGDLSGIIILIFGVVTAITMFYLVSKHKY